MENEMSVLSVSLDHSSYRLFSLLNKRSTTAGVRIQYGLHDDTRIQLYEALNDGGEKFENANK